MKTEIGSGDKKNNNCNKSDPLGKTINTRNVVVRSIFIEMSYDPI